MIKARPVAGDDDAGAAFLDKLGPFVWRRRLDFAAVQDMQGIKRKIDASRGGGQIAVEGHDVKLGRGGIREIEFFAQAQQLAWGGRDADLRRRETLPALDSLAAARAGNAPRRGRICARPMSFSGASNTASRWSMTRRRKSFPATPRGDGAHRGVHGVRLDGRLLRRPRRAICAPSNATTPPFSRTAPAAGRSRAVILFRDRAGRRPRHAARAIGDGLWRQPARLDTGARLAFRALRGLARRSARAELAADLAPAILNAFAASPDPDSALARFDGFLARLPDGARVFSLFAANPELPGLVAEIMGAAPRIAERLTRHPDLLESVLSRDFADLEVPDDIGRDAEVADAARRGLIRLFYAQRIRPRRDARTACRRARRPRRTFRTL